MSNKILELSDKLKSKIYLDYNVGKHTWFRTGGNAKTFIIIENNFELFTWRFSENGLLGYHEDKCIHKRSFVVIEVDGSYDRRQSEKASAYPSTLNPLKAYF